MIKEVLSRTKSQTRSLTLLESRAAMKASQAEHLYITPVQDTIVIAAPTSEHSIAVVEDNVINEIVEGEVKAVADRYVRLGRRGSVNSMSSRSDTSSRN